MPGNQRIGTRWNALDFESPQFIGHRKMGMVERRRPRIHMHMHVTLQPQSDPRARTRVAAISRLRRRHGNVEEAMFVAEQMRIVQNRFEN